jgi:hypothetical protein
MFTRIAGAVAVASLVAGFTATAGARPPRRHTGPAALSASGEEGSCDARKIVGTWRGARYSMTVRADGTYEASGTPNMASIDVTGTLRTEGCKATLVDTSGRYACPPGQVGRYTFAVTDTTLQFTLVSDACDGRRIPLSAGSLSRRSKQ